MPKPKPQLIETRNFVQRRPWLTWGTLAAIVAIVGVIGPWVWALMPHYVTVEVMETRITKAESAASSEDAKIKSILQAAERARAWDRWQIAYNLTVVLRNRLNDCREAREAGPETRARKASCDQYQQEYDEAAIKARRLNDAAMGFGKQDQ